MPPTTDRLAELRRLLAARLADLDEERRRLEAVLRELAEPHAPGRGTRKARKAPKRKKAAGLPRSKAARSAGPKGQQAPRPKRGGRKSR